MDFTWPGPGVSFGLVLSVSVLCPIVMPGFDGLSMYEGVYAPGPGAFSLGLGSGLPAML